MKKENKVYTLEYANETEFKKRERGLKKYNMLAYKKLMFEHYPNLRNGKFLGDVISENKKSKETQYSLKLPVDSLFEKVHGKVTLEYVVNEEKCIIYLNNILPDIFVEGYTNELKTYKGVMVSKEHSEKDMFKINLLNMLNGDK
ncbi:MAG: hypothetical protein IKL68_06540 [Clostridia bacterium]|nr:hypothetical protein [Clostridia bacterium]